MWITRAFIYIFDTFEKISIFHDHSTIFNFISPLYHFNTDKNRKKDKLMACYNKI